MEKLHRALQPFARAPIIPMVWLSAGLWFYLCLKPLFNHARTVGLNTTPAVLDALHYYTPDEGYHVLTDLGAAGRQAYRWTNYGDFAVPVLFFLSLSLAGVALRVGSTYLILPFFYMIADYAENIAEKYVLEIYPDRNDVALTMACYFGLVKFLFLYISVLIIIVYGGKSAMSYVFVQKDNKYK